MSFITNRKFLLSVKYTVLLALWVYLALVVFLDFGVEARRVMMSAEAEGIHAQYFYAGVKALSQQQLYLRVEVFTVSTIAIMLALVRIKKKEEKGAV